MTSVTEHSDDKLVEYCDDNGMEHCDEKGMDHCDDKAWRLVMRIFNEHTDDKFQGAL